MYRYIIRPLLFLLSPETVHHIVTGLIRFLFRIPGVAFLTQLYYRVESTKLKTKFLDMEFSSPVGLAAGFDKNGEVFREFYNLGFSHIEVGTVTPLGQSGNQKPRSFRIPRDKGLINRMGFNNAGVDAMVGKLKQKRPGGLIVGGNIGKNTATANENAVEDYEACFTKLYGLVDYFVVNVSCPNISDLHELQDQDGLERILGRLAAIRYEQEIRTPILLKISPDLNQKQLDTTLDIVAKYGIDGIVATNTTITREGLETPSERIEAIGKGGMSGGPLTEKSLTTVRYISSRTNGKLPIIGVGGILSVENALNLLDAGASLVQVYTGFIYNGPGFIRKINKAILKRQDQILN